MKTTTIQSKQGYKIIKEEYDQLVDPTDSLNQQSSGIIGTALDPYIKITNANPVTILKDEKHMPWQDNTTEGSRKQELSALIFGKLGVGIHFHPEDI